MSPYFIEGPALISFSGGRTSGYMLKQIIDAHDGELPKNVYVVFANTGKERHETLGFVHKCSLMWRNHVHWVEWRDREPCFEEVGFNWASRLGEPFAALIAKKKMPPNWQARFCTQFLKVRAMTAFAESKGLKDYTEVIGLRYDEGMRLMKMFERNENDGRKCYAPLAKAKVTERVVLDWWATQPFDLGLRPGEGNCDLCFLKGRGLRKEIIRQDPSRADWWSKQEQSVSGFFDRRDSYADLKREAVTQTDLFYDDVEHDVECGLLCQPGEAAE